MKIARSFSEKRSRERGLKSESVVRNVLKEMKQRGRIVEFLSTGKEEDKFCGIDFKIFLSDGVEVLLQVKSSLLGVINHRKKFPKVPAIVADAGDRTATKRRILTIIAFYEDLSKNERVSGDWFQACYCSAGKYFILKGKPISRGTVPRIGWKSRNGFQNGRWRKCG